MAAREHRYRITLEHLSTPRAGDPTHAPLAFEDGNHDDLFRIIALQRGSGRFGSEDEAAAFALGLKLLGGAVLRNRDDELLRTLKTPLGEFIRGLKASLAVPPAE